MNTSTPAAAEPLLQEPPDFSLVLGGPLYQLWRRTRLAGDALELLHRRIVAMAMAAKLGVSPYTTNETLQQKLSKVARASAGGGLVVSGATAAVGSGVGTALSVVGMNQTVQEALIKSSPEDLRMPSLAMAAPGRGQSEAVFATAALVETGDMISPWLLGE